MVYLSLCFLFASFILLATAEVPEDGWYQLRNSFKPPYIQAGGSQIAHWKTFGSAVATDQYVQLTPDEKSQLGGIWNQKPNKEKNWEVQLAIVVGKSGVIGADGMAFWYTKQPGKAGPVFGNAEGWNGLGIFFDTFDNDGKSDNPAVYGILNDGTKMFPHDTDGFPQTFGSCQLNYRTSSYEGQHHHPALFKIRYLNGVLSVYYDSKSLFGGETEWQECFSHPVKLSPGYFGVTAATGGVSDHHDVVSFVTYVLNDAPAPSKDSKSGLSKGKPKGKPNALKKSPSGKDNEDEDDEDDSVAERQKITEELREKTKEHVDHLVEKMQVPKKLSLETDEFAPNEVSERIFEIQTAQFEFASLMHKKFDGIQERLSTLEADTTSTLKALSTSMNQLVKKLEQGKSSVNVFQKDIQDLTTVIQGLQDKLNFVNENVAGTRQQADQLRQINKMRSDVLGEVIASHGTGFWIFFALFQVFFCFAAFFYKKTQDDKNRKFM